MMDLKTPEGVDWELEAQQISGPYLQRIADKLSDMVLGVDPQGELAYVSPSIVNILGYSDEVFKRLYNLAMNFSADKRFSGAQGFVERHLKTARMQLKTGKITDSEQLQLTHRDGFRISLDVVCVPFCDEKKNFAGVICICRKQDSGYLQQQEMALSAKVFDNSLAGIYITDGLGSIVQVNKAFSRLTGFAAAEFIGESPQRLDAGHYADDFFVGIKDSLKAKGMWEGEMQHRRKNGEVFPAWVSMTVLRDGEGEIRNTITHFSDITGQKNSEDKIYRLAYFDPLTGLPNRTLFSDRLNEAIKRAKRSNGEVALMFLDLDRFKNINDTLGHNLGDIMLDQVGQRLRNCVREQDTVARMGGDEFTIILGDLSDRKEGFVIAGQIADKIKAAIEEPFIISAREVFSGASIGIAFYPGDGAEPKTLIQNADTAMYHAKSVGKNNYQFYNEDMNNDAKQRLELEHALYTAVKSREFELHYQAILNSDSGATVAYETLVRWRHPEKGLLMPEDFIHIAEDTGLIVPLGDWVILQACQQWVEWSKEGVQPPRLAINVSTRQFCEGSIVKTLRSILENTTMPAELIEFEIAESALMVDHQYAQKILEELKSLGVTITLDDFGTGYSSLNYLKHFPIDNLKIGRSFVEGLPGNEDKQIIRAIVSLAKSLNLKVIAEGVETPIQLEFVQDIGCDEVQGYLLSGPKPVEEIFTEVPS